MATNIILQVGLYLLLLCLLTKPMGLWINTVMTGKKHLLSRIGEPVESFFYKLAGVNVNTEMTWKHYTFALISFNLLGVIVVFLLQKLSVHDKNHSKDFLCCIFRCKNKTLSCIFLF